jgi:hypothetical protein
MAAWGRASNYGTENSSTPPAMPGKFYYRKSAFRVKKPVRSFRDLEIYQRTAEYATEVMTKVLPLLGESDSPVKDKLINCCLNIPELIASAHSRRFEKGEELKLLDNALEACNKVVVYLEQARDIFVKGLDERATCEDLIKRYILIRRKIFNLYKAWRKFHE